MNRTTKIKITELNPHVICVLCGGYYINATTITECLHSFCRTCITRYLETSKYCPVCDVMVHKTRPLDYIRSDKTLQDLVYKLVPGLYKSEMKRRREYYAVVDTPGVARPPSEDRGAEFHDRIIYTEDEKISLSLELCADGIPFKTPLSVHGHTGPENIRIKDVRYLQCPAAFSVGNLKKFIRMKFDLKLKYEIDIFHTAEPLPDYYSLMDIAYIYTWTRRAPLRLYYTVYERRLPPKAPDPISRDQSNRADDDIENQNAIAAKIKAGVKNMSKKRKLLEGPDDISPDLDFEKCRPYKGDRRKGIGTPKKRVKKTLIEVDDTMNEAMSESEEQLARLTLDSSDVGRGTPSKTGSTSLEEKDTTGIVRKVGGETYNGETNTDESQNENTKDVVKTTNKTSGEENYNLEMLTNITVETNADSLRRNGDTGATVLSEKDNSSKQSSAQGSPGAGSISLSLFQPLNAVGLESGDTTTGHSSNNLNTHGRKSEKVYEFGTEETTIPVKKGRGRPKGSKNKVTCEKHTVTKKKTKETNSTSDGETSLVASTHHPGIKSPKANRTAKKPDSKGDISYKNSPAKTKVNVGATKVALTDKTKFVNGEKPKRKYVRKNKPENEDETDRESKRPKKDKNNSEGKDGSEILSDVSEQVIERLDYIHKDQAEGAMEENVTDSSHVSSTDGGPHKRAEERKEILQNVNKTGERVNDNDKEKQIPLNSTALQEPVTPLYGETPKMNESNQGLPCSPNMESLDNSGRLVIDTNVNSEDLNGANTKRESDNNVVKCNTTQSNGAISENMKLSNGNFVLNRALSKEMYQNSFGGFDKNQSEQLSRNNTDIPNAHTDQFRHSVNSLSPPNTMNNIMLNAYSQPSMNYLHIGHVTGNSNNFTSHDPNFDQPLDLTSNGARDEYTKGKIFKTKMLKKSYPKQQDIVQNFKENNSANQFHH